MTMDLNSMKTEISSSKMKAINKEAGGDSPPLKTYSQEQRQLILTRPDKLNQYQAEERNRLLKQVHDNGWWLRCGCSSNPNVILFTRKTKNAVTACRNGSALEHSVVCPVRNWEHHGKSKMPKHCRDLFLNILDETDVGKLSLADYGDQRLTKQYASIREFAKNVQIEHGHAHILTHPSALKGIHRLVHSHPEDPVFAAVVVKRVEKYRLYCTTGDRIECPVTKAPDIQPSAKTWLAIIKYSQCGQAIDAWVHPVISAADLVVVGTSSEYFLVQTLRSLIRYWSQKYSKQIEARRTYRNGEVVWCLYENTEDKKRYFGDIVLTHEVGRDETKEKYGAGTHAISLKSEDGKQECQKVRKWLTWQLFNG